jgi:hypothetical protein
VEAIMAESKATTPQALGDIWSALKKWIWKYGGTLVMEQKDDGEYAMSLGRVALCVLLGQAMWQWAGTSPGAVVDLPAGMKETLFLLMAYNFGTKGISTARKWMEGRRANGAEPR